LTHATPKHDDEAAAKDAKARNRARRTLEELKLRAVGKQHASLEMQVQMIEAANLCGEPLADIAEWLVDTFGQRVSWIRVELREAVITRNREAALARTRELVSS
jgi:hypothetical protein